MGRLKLCAEPGCWQETRNGRCDLHKKQGGPTKPYNDARHREWARQVLELHPICLCGKKATHADHKIPIADDASLRFVLSNGQGLCASCHSRKTLAEVKQRVRLSAI